jgi:hypothetical protein
MNKLIFLILLLPVVCFAKPEWEKVTCEMSSPCIYRLCVPHGWLVTRGAQGLAFYPDEKHEWRID